VLCGIVEAEAIFKSKKIYCRWEKREGQSVMPGEIVCTLYGNARAILACERTALNFLSILCGIATQAKKASERFGRWKIAATRKTLPFLAHSQKRAVLLGGCLTHRMSLAGKVLVKDNHLALIKSIYGVDEERAVEIACNSFPRRQPVQVEVSSKKAAAAAARFGASAILVDNVSPSKLSAIAKAARLENPEIIVEASGGITLENAGKYLEAGADFCSTSKLTLGFEPADLSLEITGIQAPLGFPKQLLKL
jgi:nicotinate-nucleotide pyrophosphorylase (carboxylating)